MTEAEWLSCLDPVEMFFAPAMNAPNAARKLRLFVCGECLRGQAASESEFVQVREVIERFADGKATESELRSAARTTRVSSRSRVRSLLHHAAQPDEYMLTAARLAILGDSQTRQAQAECLHCIFGNSFGPVAIDPRWRTADTVTLARGIYEDRAFERMPLLADALMDAGCADEQVIGHCRSEGPHVRGCWVVDLVLGKE
jgi:hypothetical protein